MIFEHKGIRIEATTKLREVKYMDSVREKDVTVYAHFWNFTVSDDLHELAFVKSCLHFFLQSFWRCNAKNGRRIELAETLHHLDAREGDEGLHFAARQKKGKYSLYVCVEKEGTTINEIYLNGREVIMLDIAIGKAIHLLTPAIIHDIPICDSTPSMTASENIIPLGRKPAET